MDEALKARKLGSATARRLRIQERQLQQQLAHQERIDRKRQVMSEIRVLEAADEESDISSPSTPGLDFDAHTPSESSVRTPEESSSVHRLSPLPSESYNTVVHSNVVKRGSKQSDLTIPQPLSRPKMQATLTTMADWNYDRFSVIFDPSEVEEMLEANVGTSVSLDSDEDFEEYSPIEVATPVLYTIPATKPSVISIISSRARSCAPHPIEGGSAMEQRLLRKRVPEQRSSNSSQEGFRAGEASLFQMSNSSRETVTSGNDSSQVSRSVSLASYNDSIVSRSVSQTSQSDQSSQSPKRKSSIPLLFGNNKAGHSRMSSLKKLMRSSTMGPPSVMSQTSTSLERQPSNSTLATHFENQHSSVEMSRSSAIEQPQLLRSTQAPPSPLLPDSFTMMTYPQSSTTNIEPETQRAPRSNPQTITKPISKFRARSGSLGLSLKSITSGPKKADTSAPPMPNLFIPPASPNPSLNSVSLPPPLSPRSPFRTTTPYSTFLSGDRPAQGDTVGLGLRY